MRRERPPPGDFPYGESHRKGHLAPKGWPASPVRVLGRPQSAHTGSRRLPWRSFPRTAAWRPATLFIPATCAHCRKRVRSGTGRYVPALDAHCTESILCSFAFDFGLSSTLARFAGRKRKSYRGFVVGPRKGSAHATQALAESLKGQAGREDRARGDRGQHRDVLSGHLRDKGVCVGDFVPSGSLFCGFFLYSKESYLPWVSHPQVAVEPNDFA